LKKINSLDIKKIKKTITIAIAGNPNAGKTSVFNNITGSVQSVGNYPGVTVEIKKGKVDFEGYELIIVDLPGIYSLTPYSQEELIARNYIIEEVPDVVINVVDASNLERNLYLTVQLLEMEIPTVICLNMIDMANRKGLEIDNRKLSLLLGIPVVSTIGNKGKGIDELLKECVTIALSKYSAKAVTYGHEVESSVMDLTTAISHDEILMMRSCNKYKPRWLAIKLMEGDKEVEKIVEESSGDHSKINKICVDIVNRIDEHYNEQASTIIAERRYGFAAGAVKASVKDTQISRRDITNKIDSVVCHRFFGPVILIGVIYSLFYVVFKFAGEWGWIFGKSPTQIIELFFKEISLFILPISTRMPMIYSLLNDGIISGIGSVLSFIPLIGIMFLFIAFLEDWGYVARIAFILDRLLKVFGLQGKSILALILAGGLGIGGCAVPGIMATRTLREEKDRLITILVTPFMNCGAKMPAYFMLIAAFFAHSREKMLFALWIISWILALIAAFILRKFMFKGEQTPFIMELPPYHCPTLKGVLLHTKERLWMYMKKAGTLILGVNLIIWVFMYFPRLPDQKLIEYKQKIEHLHTTTDRELFHNSENMLAKERLENSFAGRLGRLLAPVTKLAGFEWQTNVALIGGFAAKEVIVSTLGTAYSMGNLDPENAEPLAERLSQDQRWSKLKAFALMVFILVYAPCFATLAVIKRETGKWRWALFSTAYSTTLAFVLATVIYQVGTVLGL
jgi:ferrous iron transport protein B